MIKKISINKFVCASLSLVLMLLFYFFPSNSDLELEYNVDVIESSSTEVVYLLDNDYYLSKLNVFIDETDIKTLIEEKLLVLRDGSSDFDKFNTLIPQNTKIIDISVDKTSVFINFSKELLDVKKELEEKMIEAIVYSLTEINGINDIYIKVEGELLTMLPNSKKKLDQPLNRSFGINKEYDLINFNNIDKTTVFFIKEEDDFKYYVPVTKISNEKTDKIDIIINELQSSVNYSSNLMSYLSNSAKVEDYNITENTMNIVFNEFIFDEANNNILEEVKYTIGYSVLENYEVNKVNFIINDEKVIELVK